MIKSIKVKGYKSFKKNSIKTKKQKLLKAGMLSYTHRKKKKKMYEYSYRDPSKKLGVIQKRMLNTLPLTSLNIFSNSILKKENKKNLYNKEYLIFNII